MAAPGALAAMLEGGGGGSQPQSQQCLPSEYRKFELYYENPVIYDINRVNHVIHNQHPG